MQLISISLIHMCMNRYFFHMVELEMITVVTHV